jgi:hypothetical protein
VTCVLVGAETTLRRWVRYEILQSFIRGNGILAVRIHNIQNLQRQTSTEGPNPLSDLAFTISGDRLHFKEYMQSGWEWARDVQSMQLADVAYNLAGMTNNTLSCLFPIYDYIADRGYENLPTWIEKAAQAAGR